MPYLAHWWWCMLVGFFLVLSHMWFAIIITLSINSFDSHLHPLYNYFTTCRSRSAS